MTARARLILSAAEFRVFQLSTVSRRRRRVRTLFSGSAWRRRETAPAYHFDAGAFDLPGPPTGLQYTREAYLQDFLRSAAPPKKTLTSGAGPV